MILTEENYIEQINGFHKDHWKPLLDLIPEIEKTSKFGEMKFPDNKDGIISPPFYVESPVVFTFLEVVYKLPIIVDFNWPEWNEGQNILNDKNFNFDSIDIPTKCKLITAIVRQDRFSEGTLIRAFDSGLMYKILISIKKQLAGV